MSRSSIRRACGPRWSRRRASRRPRGEEDSPQMEPWKKKTGMLRGTRFVTQLNPLERETLGNCAATVADALMERVRTAPKDEQAELTGMTSGHSEPPSSPALARILPNFFAEGAEKVEGDAALTRQLNGTAVLQCKVMNLALTARHNRS